jgi:hypothetical protein
VARSANKPEQEEGDNQPLVFHHRRIHHIIMETKMFKLVGTAGLFSLLAVTLVMAGIAIVSGGEPAADAVSNAYWIALALCGLLFLRKKSRPQSRKIRQRRVGKMQSVDEYLSQQRRRKDS